MAEIIFKGNSLESKNLRMQVLCFPGCFLGGNESVFFVTNQYCGKIDYFAV